MLLNYKNTNDGSDNYVELISRITITVIVTNNIYIAPIIWSFP
jgi:hypothetical protein